MAEMELKYKAAEREVRALEGKVGQLERKVVRERVGSADSQAAAVANAEECVRRPNCWWCGCEQRREREYFSARRR